MWLTDRKHKGLHSLREVRNFAVVDEILFEEYDAFTELSIAHGK